MSLVAYSSDEEESCDDHCDGTLSHERCQDKESIIGRVRTFAHERGNWATYVYIPIPLSDSICELQSRIVRNFENDSSVQLHSIDSIHISLTRTVILQHHWIDDFEKSVRKCTVDRKKFTLNLNTLAVYCNDECTTTFVAIAVPDVYCAPLKELVQQFDNCLSEYKLPSFYKDASFHVSILWCLGNKKAKILMELQKLQLMLHEAIEDDYEDYQIVVDRIECKIGNKVYNYPLLS